MIKASGYCSEGLYISNNCYAPEEILRAKFGKTYAQHPILSRVVAVPLGALAGALRPFLFPLWNLVVSVALPIIALVRHLLGKKDASGYLQAWGFSLLGTVGVVTFFWLAAFHLSLLSSVGIFLGATSLCITIHVYRAVKAPSFTLTQN